MPNLAFRYWDKYTVFYVSSIPGHDGVDWGYSKTITQAIPLNRYWQRRFKKDMERVNSTAYFVPQPISFEGNKNG